MRKKYKGLWTMKVDGMWYDKINHIYTDNPDFDRGNYSTNYDSPFKKLITRKLSQVLDQHPNVSIVVLYWTTNKGKRKLKEWFFN